MKIDPVEIGRRIREAREACELSQDDLVRSLSGMLSGTTKAPKSVKVSRQTISNWEAGRPQLETLGALASVFMKLKPGLGYDEQFLIFGQRRGEQLAAERPVLVYVDPEELRLLQSFRHTDKSFRADVIANAETMRKNHPLPAALVKQFGRRHNDH